jgi:wyosine [tRNA(Phe)-imidazoG37] synthetase (radical SAM superfamily)
MAIYGPVPSWRLGRSLGIDPISRREKTCSFDCVYCQLGQTINKIRKREVFVDEKIIEKELKEIQDLDKKADVITLSGTGEPTLAKNLGRIINIIRENADLPIAILTNSSLIQRRDVQNDLKKLDIVVAKLDAVNEALFSKIDRPCKGVTFKHVVDGISSFRTQFSGKLALQIMFIKENMGQARKMARLAKRLEVDEVQLNTPLRQCAVKPLGKKEIELIKVKFKGLNVVSVWEAKKPRVEVIDKNQTLMRRPKK